MNLDEIRRYLPKYLSPETEEDLFRDLSMFPDNIDDRMFATLSDSTVFQGDAIRGLPVMMLPRSEIKTATCLILSNTCDVDPNNKRLFAGGVVYTPLVALSSYVEMLKGEGIAMDRVQNHTRDIRRQSITQIFYTPRSASMDESIAFFDRLVSNDATELPSPAKKNRAFSLSQYGHYMLLYKMSMHFTRIAESADRKY